MTDFCTSGSHLSDPHRPSPERQPIQYQFTFQYPRTCHPGMPHIESSWSLTTRVRLRCKLREMLPFSYQNCPVFGERCSEQWINTKGMWRCDLHIRTFTFTERKYYARKYRAKVSRMWRDPITWVCECQDLGPKSVSEQYVRITLFMTQFAISMTDWLRVAHCMRGISAPACWIFWQIKISVTLPSERS